MNSESQDGSILLETQYLPAVSAFVMMQSFSAIVIDGEENFRKSTRRNRCTIINANGQLLLTIPIVGGRGVRSKTKDVRIANDQPWQNIHWRSMISAYSKSSFFIFYEARFRALYEKRFEFLIDFNMELLRLCFEILHWKKIIRISRSIENGKHNLLTESFGKPAAFNPEPYHQVFESKHGFISPASIVDLIFNLGNDAQEYLKRHKW